MIVPVAYIAVGVFLWPRFIRTFAYTLTLGDEPDGFEWYVSAFVALLGIIVWPLVGLVLIGVHFAKAGNDA